MDALIESIRSALAPDATPEACAAGAAACRTIMTALEAKPGEPMTTPVVPAASAIANAVAALRSMPADHVLDLLIAKLRSVTPAGTEPPRVQSFKFQRVPVPGGKP